MLIDSHCHLQFLDLEAFDHKLENVIAHAKACGVEQLLSVATALNQHETLLSYTKAFEAVFASIGLHPNEIKQCSDIPSLDVLLSLGDYPKMLAFGETGLDFYRQETVQEKAYQRESLAVHIEAAKRLQKPLIIHTRAAKIETMALLKSHDAGRAGGVLHCFTEDYEMAKKALDIDFYISFSGIVTFKKAIDLQEVARKIPIDRMLIETDAPYLAPTPYRGKQNVPGYVREVALFLAALRDETFEHVASKTSENFKRLFLCAK